MAATPGKKILPCIMASLYLLGNACTNHRVTTLFTKMPAHETGIAFQNTINYNDSFNILDYVYFYNCGGVATGDINNDGLQDIYFTSNQGSINCI